MFFIQSKDCTYVLVHLYWQSLSISAEMRLIAQGLGFLHPLPSLLLRRIFDEIVYFVTRRPFVAYPLTPVVMTIRVVWSYPYIRKILILLIDT